MSTAPEGLLLVDKPCGPTSHDVVERIRRSLGQPRAGHSGTLDPGASGLLAIALGRATRLVRFLPQAPKVYEGRMRLGVTTMTDDLQGEVLHRWDGSLPEADAVLLASRALLGQSEQVPPAVSARKVGGERMYRLARAGRTVAAPASAIDVFRLDLEPTSESAEWRFVAEVSSGTYIRALARDLGRALGCGAALAALRRTSIGPLSIMDAVTLGPDATDPSPEALFASVIPLDAMPLTPPAMCLEIEEQVRRFVNGLPAAGRDLAAAGPRRIVDPSGRLLGVGELDAGWVRPRVVVAPAESHPPDRRV